MSKSALIAAGFSAHLGVEVKTKADAERISQQKPGQVVLRPVTIHCLFSHTFDEITPDESYAVQVFGEDRQHHKVDPNLSVKEIKELLGKKVGVRPDSQTLLFGGKQLQDSQSLVQQNIPAGIVLAGPQSQYHVDEPVQVHHIDEDDLEPKYNYDFTKLKDDGTKYQKGGYVYDRPYGCETAALKVGVRPDFQTLLFGGKQLQDSQPLVQQNICAGIVLAGPQPQHHVDEPVQVYYIDEDDLEPKYNYDFTKLKDDGTKYQRGGYVYARPYGWERAALKVLGRYSDDVWLGQIGDRTDSSPGEWVVSYHGTGSQNPRPIARDGYRAGSRRRFGPGIYSSPSIKVAENPDYSKPFSYNGEQFQMVLQNRVNLAKCDEVSAEMTGAGAPFFIAKDKDNIRPYGILLRKL